MFYYCILTRNVKQCILKYLIRKEERKASHVMAIYIVAAHKQEAQIPCKNRQCHVNNISINLEHNDEQDEKKLKDNNYEHE